MRRKAQKSQMKGIAKKAEDGGERIVRIGRIEVVYGGGE
jgi:hypothetical protein